MVLLAAPEKPHPLTVRGVIGTLSLAFLLPSLAESQLRLERHFSDHMVLQRGRPIVINGFGHPGSRVSVLLDDSKRTTTVSADSTWEVRLPKRRASKRPLKLTVGMDGRSIILDDILIGDVWLCIGQSNMEWPMSREKHWGREKSEALQPLIRFANPPPAGRYVYGVPYGDSLKSRLTSDRFYAWDGWRRCDSQTVASMSAVAYHFAKRVRVSVDVPVGLVNLSIGGAPLESFIGVDDMAGHPVFRAKVKGNWLTNDALPVWIRERGRQNLGTGNFFYSDSLGPSHAFKPGFAYASAVDPLSQHPVKGVLVYQGESNAEEPPRVLEYGELFKLMVDSYRSLWKEPRLPFYWVQLSSIERPHWPLFRDVQRRMLETIGHSGMAVTIDVGARNDVHPTDKKTVGERLALLALAQTYGKPVVPSGPLPVAARFRESAVVVSFRHAGSGLKTSDGLEPREFSFGGMGDTKAILRGSRVVIPVDVRPDSIRYGWRPFSTGNLVNSVGLPASTFKIAVR
jgi:sialate O-acetylesterase